MASYRSIIYLGTLLTGVSGLVYQVVWQKYLSFVVGSEARSVSLVVAVFLAGLAAGYSYWGKLSERFGSRRRLLRLYGFVEIGIGIYAVVFPFYLHVIRLVSYNGPALLVTDVVVTIMALLAPTFLMGATIPLLVRVVPENVEEVHTCHARIYGINALGACLGAFGAGVFLIPALGLPGSLRLAGAANVVVGIVFVLNRLSHEIAPDERIREIPNRFGVGTVYAFVLATGTIGLSLEVLFVRVLGLTVGTGPYNFAIVVGVFILGLAIGSLMLSERLLSVRYLFGALSFMIVYLMVLYLSVPYWPYWLNNARACLVSLPVNYHVYSLVITGFVMIALLPFLIPLGSMLPLAYALLPKTSTDYGKKCGWMYFYNTLGTALGAIVFSYLLLHFFDLDQVFKIDVAIVSILALYLFFREKRWALLGVLAILCLGFLLGPSWDRSSHYLGLYRNMGVDDFNFQGVFRTPRLAPEVTFFEDGPDASITATYFSPGQRVVQDPAAGSGARPRVETVYGRSMAVNGKGDGDTIVDYSTITLAAMLPYLHAPQRPDLEAALIGFGTGMTASVLGQAEDVSHVTAVEISSTLVKIAPHFDDMNDGLSRNPKVDLVAMDGFKYFTRLDGQLDIVVSASSPPWIGGVEMLFTPEFYRLADGALVEDGVFLQWFPMYTMDAVLLKTILKNLQSVFPHTRLYKTSVAEMAILASKTPLRDEPLKERLAEPAMSRIAAKMRLHDSDLLVVLDYYQHSHLEFLAGDGSAVEHTLVRPSLSYASDKIRFVNATIRHDDFLDARLARFGRYTEARGALFAAAAARYPSGLDCRGAYGGERFLCDTFNPVLSAYWTIASEGASAQDLATAYDALRQEGVWPADAALLRRIMDRLTEGATPATPPPTGVIEIILVGYVKDGLFDEAGAELQRLLSMGLIGKAYHDRILGDVEGSRRFFAAFAESYRRSAG